MYFNHIKYIPIDLKLIKIDLLLNKTLKYLIICVGSILASCAMLSSMQLCHIIPIYWILQ